MLYAEQLGEHPRFRMVNPSGEVETSRSTLARGRFRPFRVAMPSGEVKTMIYTAPYHAKPQVPDGEPIWGSSDHPFFPLSR